MNTHIVAEGVCWKVCERVEGTDQFRSCRAYLRARVTYRVGEWAAAPPWLASQGYHLLAFDSQRAGENYCVGSDTDILFRAEYAGLVPLPPIAMFCLVSLGCAPRAAEGIAWPLGTIMVRHLRLLERER